MTEWNAGHYLKYGDERTRPAWDLAARIQLEAPQKIVDLGCGPGNSTQVLRSRWPDADITGIDSSSTMIENARRDWPDHNWLQADISGWTGNSPYDLVFSNAALQWIPNHHLLIPSSVFAVVRTLIHEISCDPEWTDRMTGARSALTMEAPSF